MTDNERVRRTSRRYREDEEREEREKRDEVGTEVQLGSKDRPIAQTCAALLLPRERGQTFRQAVSMEADLARPGRSSDTAVRQPRNPGLCLRNPPSCVGWNKGGQARRRAARSGSVGEKGARQAPARPVGLGRFLAETWPGAASAAARRVVGLFWYSWVVGLGLQSACDPRRAHHRPSQPRPRWQAASRAVGVEEGVENGEGGRHRTCQPLLELISHAFERRHPVATSKVVSRGQQGLTLGVGGRFQP